MLRTGELDALHRYDGVEQYFGLAYEFGFSFSVEETFAKWGREATLGDVVRVVRAFRPDVMLTLPLSGEGGGQHHQAAGRLAAEAFRAAADPARFPEQLREGLRPWQARKIYVGGVGGFDDAPKSASVVHVPTGVYDPLLGATWQQLGSRARALHRCQMSTQLVADPGPAEGVYGRLDAEPAAPEGETDLLAGVDTTLRGLARFAPGLADTLSALQEQAEAARGAFDAAGPGAGRARAGPGARVAARARGAPGRGRGRRDGAQPSSPDGSPRRRRTSPPRSSARSASSFEARADDGLVAPGQAVNVAVSLWNPSGTPVEAAEVALDVPEGWASERRAGEPGPVGGGGAARPELRRARLPAGSRLAALLAAPAGPRPQRGRLPGRPDAALGAPRTWSRARGSGSPAPS